jgi:hypothetical protein
MIISKVAQSSIETFSNTRCHRGLELLAGNHVARIMTDLNTTIFRQALIVWQVPLREIEVCRAQEELRNDVVRERLG